MDTEVLEKIRLEYGELLHMGKLRVINSSTSDRLNSTVTYCTAVTHQCMTKVAVEESHGLIIKTVL